jgi:hypothetical protein
MKKILILFIISLSLSSCGTFRINTTSDFGKIKDLSELNGTYRNEDTPLTKAQSILKVFWGASENRLKMLQLVGCLKCLDEDIETAIAIRESIDSVTIQFPDNHTLLVSFSANGTVLNQEFKGKKKRKYFEIYSHKEQFIIPLIYGHVSVGRLRIGRYKKTNDLLIRNLSEQMGWILFIGGGYGGERPYIYGKYIETTK